MTSESPEYLRKTFSDQAKTIKELEIVIGACEREIAHLQLILKDNEFKLDNYVRQNMQLKQERHVMIMELEGLRNLFREHGNQRMGPKKYPNESYSPKLQGRGALKQSKIQPPVQNLTRQEYVIEPIRIKKEVFRENEIVGRTHESIESSVIEKNAGTTLAQDFLVIGPDVNDIGIFQQKNPTSNSIKLKPSLLFQWDKNTKNVTAENRNKEILLRAFPDEIEGRKVKGKKYDGQVREVLEWIPNYSLSEGYFVFNLLGSLDYKDNSKKLLSQSNVNKQMYILCLKLPDIVSFKGRRAGQGDIWIVEKIFAISSYYPFFDSHIRCIVELCRALVLHRVKQLKQGKERFQYFGLEFSTRAFSEPNSVTEILKSYMNRKPIPSEVYALGSNIMGTLMSNQSSRLAQAAFASGMLFSNIAYDQFLLILTAMLCEKTVILVSKSPTISTFCALSLIGLITPFKYSHTVILNCDKNKVDNIIFQSPFPIVASITTNDISELVSEAVETNIRNEGAQFVLFDLDSNSILMDKHLKNSLEKLIPAPPEDLRQQYLEYNPCKAKSLFLPKQMKIVKGGMGKKNKTKLEEKEELKRLIEEQFMEEIEQNQSKSINWSPNYNLTQKFNLFVSQFQYDGKFSKLKNGQDAKQNINAIKQNMLRTHKNYKPFLSVFLENQIFAEYLDSKLYP